MSRRGLLSAFWVLAGVSTCTLPVLRAQGNAAAAPGLSRAEKEQFLLNAKILKTRPASKGITGTLRATLSDGRITHDASIQTIDQSMPLFQTPSGTELNFRDTYKFNLAAYKLDQLLGLNMIPVTVERKYAGSAGSFTWWVEGVAMDEAQRLKDKIEPPDPASWNEQMCLVRIFDQLIYNVDRNLGNLLITKDWQIWMIDHGRAFRRLQSLKGAENLTRCDRELYNRLKALTEADLKRELGRWLIGDEMKALLKRRDAIVKHFEAAGESAFFVCPRRS